MPTVLYGGCACSSLTPYCCDFGATANVRIGELNQPGREVLSLKLQRLSVLVPPSSPYPRRYESPVLPVRSSRHADAATPAANRRAR